MQLVRRFGGHRRRVFPALALTAAALVASACSSDQSGSGPVLPGNPPHNPQITRAAFLADVNVRTGEIRIAPPELTGTQGGLLRANSTADGQGVELSLVGGDVVTLTSSNFVASAVGAFQPGKVRVTFDVNVTNKLNGVQLIGPTVFPAPPAGSTGPLLFPYDIAVAVTTGGTATGGQGNDIIVTLPSYGLVSPSTDWDGAPHNFFNDTGCPAGANDCYRWEEYPGPIFPGSTTIARSVGFDLDPTVGQFTARLIVAADLQNSGAAPTGTISGTVTSPQIPGGLNGVTVTATAGITTLNGTTAGAGAYSIATVPTGPASVAITSGLPAGCTNPGSQSTTVNNGATSTVDFTVTCPVPSGTVNGTISFTGASPSPTGISVVVTPTGGGAQPGVNPNAAGAYTRNNVPVGTGAGSVALSNLPSGCTNPGPGSYSGLTSGGTQTVNFTVACTPPPAGYAYVGTAVDNGATVTISFTLNMSTFNDPAVPDANEQMGAFEGSFTYPTARLQATACNYGGAGGAGTVLGSPVPPNFSTPGTVLFSGINTNAALGGALFTVLTCTFNDLGGATPISTSTNITLAFDSGAAFDFLPNIIVTEASAP
jgi:hypothetical protein